MRARHVHGATGRVRGHDYYIPFRKDDIQLVCALRAGGATIEKRNHGAVERSLVEVGYV